MKTVILKNKTVKLYDSIDEMPIVNFQKYNKCLIIDSGLGSDVDSVDSHIINVAKYINKGDKENAMQELQNMRQTLHMLVSEVSPKNLAFAALIHSIDGKEQKDLSDEHLKEIIDDLGGVPYNLFINILNWLKKKLSSELELYFPGEFENAREKEAYAKLKERTMFQLQEIIDDKKYTEQIAEIDEFLFSLHKPKKFIGKESEEIKYDKQFESACMIISQKTGMNAKQMTVLEFYNTLTNIQKQLEAEKKAYSKHNFKRH
jgi:hypothetical protein